MTFWLAGTDWQGLLQFTDQGSTKERLTRPVRKLLAKDPVGPGM